MKYDLVDGHRYAHMCVINLLEHGMNIHPQDNFEDSSPIKIKLPLLRPKKCSLGWKRPNKVCSSYAGLA